MNIKREKKVEEEISQHCQNLQGDKVRGGQNVTLFGNFEGKDLQECNFLQVEKVEA